MKTLNQIKEWIRRVDELAETYSPRYFETTRRGKAIIRILGLKKSKKTKPHGVTARANKYRIFVNGKPNVDAVEEAGKFLLADGWNVNLYRFNGPDDLFPFAGIHRSSAKVTNMVVFFEDGESQVLRKSRNHKVWK